MHIHKYIYIHTYMNAHKHTQIHLHTQYTYIQQYMSIHSNTQICIHIHTCAHTHTRMAVRTWGHHCLDFRRMRKQKAWLALGQSLTHEACSPVTLPPLPSHALPAMWQHCVHGFSVAVQKEWSMLSFCFQGIIVHHGREGMAGGAESWVINHILSMHRGAVRENRKWDGAIIKPATP